MPTTLKLYNPRKYRKKVFSKFTFFLAKELFSCFFRSPKEGTTKDRGAESEGRKMAELFDFGLKFSPAISCNITIHPLKVRGEWSNTSL